MAAKLSTLNVMMMPLGSEIAAKGGYSCTRNRSLCTASTCTTRIARTGSSVFSNPILGGAPFLLRASSGPNPTDSTSSTDNPNSSTPQDDDSQYVLKLGVGSVLGAAIIKYGSIVIPDITRPNIIQALLMIGAPVVIAVLLLLKGSRKE